MDVQITINCDNAAFEGYPGSEVARILRNLAGKLDMSTAITGSQVLVDINGNRVGLFEAKED